MCCAVGVRDYTCEAIEMNHTFFNDDITVAVAGNIPYKGPRCGTRKKGQYCK